MKQCKSCISTIVVYLLTAAGGDLCKFLHHIINGPTVAVENQFSFLMLCAFALSYFELVFQPLNYRRHSPYCA